MSIWTFRKPDVKLLTVRKDFQALFKAARYRKDVTIRIDAVKALAELVDQMFAEREQFEARHGFTDEDLEFSFQKEWISQYIKAVYPKPSRGATGSDDEVVKRAFGYSTFRMSVRAAQALLNVITSDETPEVVDAAARALAQIEARVVSLRHFRSIAGAVSTDMTLKNRAEFWRAQSPLEPRIYGEELKELRAELERNGYMLCLRCDRQVKIDLAKIEAEIRARRATARDSSFRGGVVFRADISRGLVCKSCKRVYCGQCAQEMQNILGEVGLFSLACVKSPDHDLQGIDHITD